MASIMKPVFGENEIAAIKALFESLEDSGDFLGGFNRGPLKSPRHRENSVPVQATPVILSGERHPFGLYNGFVYPQAQPHAYAIPGVASTFSPPDPRYNVYGLSPSFAPPNMYPQYQGYMQPAVAVPALPYFNYGAPGVAANTPGFGVLPADPSESRRSQSSKSRQNQQTAHRRKPLRSESRISSGGTSSDSDEAEMTSRKIVESKSTDPRDLLRILKKSSSKKGRSEGTQQPSEPSAVVPCDINEWTAGWATWGGGSDVRSRTRRSEELREVTTQTRDSRKEGRQPSVTKKRKSVSADGLVLEDNFKADRRPSVSASYDNRGRLVHEDEDDLFQHEIDEELMEPLNLPVRGGRNDREKGKHISKEKKSSRERSLPRDKKGANEKHSRDAKFSNKAAREKRSSSSKMIFSNNSRDPQNSALVPVTHSPSKARTYHNHRKSFGKREQTWWDPPSEMDAKRQRLPVLDWRKGEKYCRNRDGIVIGKEGYSKPVFDDSVYFKKSKGKREVSMDASTEDDSNREVSEVPRVAPRLEDRTKEHKKRRSTSSVRAPVVAHEEASMTALQIVPGEDLVSWPLPQLEDLPTRSASSSFVREKKQERRKSSGIGDFSKKSVPRDSSNKPSSKAGSLNVWDRMKKNRDGIYMIQGFQILHRAVDRAWSEKDDENGFMISPGIHVDTGFVAQLCLRKNMMEGSLDVVDVGNCMYVQVLMAERNSIRVLVDGNEEWLNETDEMYIGPGSSYSITNVSKTRDAILTVTMIR